MVPASMRRRRAEERDATDGTVLRATPVTLSRISVMRK